ncbi:MAG: FAD-dependent oxidoreductase [Rhodospirillales bacterium]|nr:FAD-dependent oxidoreductase [Rhodospirillales bacterium]
MPINVAIVGAGPAGFYTAEALLQRDADIHVDFIERLPTPYGLIRAGVAPDHQTTKKVSRKFDQTANKDLVRYYGNVEVGRDVALEELQALYDAVVLAVGAPADRYIGIPGEDKLGVFGSALVVGWYNGHPDFSTLRPDLNTPAVVVIGNGNVALDVARVLVKTPEELALSDIADYAAAAIRGSPLTDVYLLGRRGPLQARFTNVELRELEDLADAVPVVDPGDLPEAVPGSQDREGRLKEKNLATLRAFSALDPVSKRKRIHFRFFANPVEIVGGERVEGVRYEETRLDQGRIVGTGRMQTIACGLVVSAIGYRSQVLPGMPDCSAGDCVPNVDGRVAPGLYAVGWAKRGPIGVIASNRPDGSACAEQIAADIARGEKPGRGGLEPLLAKRGVRVVGFEDWRRIDAAEVAAAEAGAPRRKFTTLGEMLGVLEPESRGGAAQTH